jgi:hypothetical protein
MIMPPNAYGELFTLLPIYAASVLLGLVSGIVASQLFANGAGRLSLRALMGIVALAALISCLVAAKPEFWEATTSFWAMAAVVMAVVDLSVVCLIDPWQETRRFSKWSVRSRIAWPALGISGAVAGVLVVLMSRFDTPLRTEALPSFALGLVVIVLVLAVLDVAAHLAVLRWSRWRRIHERTCPGLALEREVEEGR